MTACPEFFSSLIWSGKPPADWTPKTTYREFINSFASYFDEDAHTAVDALHSLVERGIAIRMNHNLVDLQNFANMEVNKGDTEIEFVFTLPRYADLINSFRCPVDTNSFELLACDAATTETRVVFSYGQPVKAGEVIEFTMPIPSAALVFINFYVRMRFDTSAVYPSQAAHVAPIVNYTFLDSSHRDTLRGPNSYFPLMIGVKNGYATLTIESKDLVRSLSAV